MALDYPETLQQKSVRGQVVDNQNQPLPGVTVLVKGTNIGAFTNNNGMYTIEFGTGIPDPILVFSFIGMNPIEEKVDARSVINVTMESAVIALDELVVIGYGTVRKSDITGSVSSIDAAETFVAPVANISQAIQGRAAGVFVTSASNEPGGGTTIRIRGGNSITAGNEPLYVIDGVIGAALNSIAPNDIESIEVLKDASSTAIYGTRGANGVILITSKKGTIGKPKVIISTSHGWQKVAGKINVRNGREFAEFYNNGALNTGVEPIYDLNNLPEETDWQDVALRNAYITDNSISLQGGTQETQYYISGNYLKQDGIQLSNEFRRYNFNLNIDQKVSDLLKVGVTFRYLNLYSDNPKYGAGTLATLSPLLSVYDENGDYTYQWASGVLFDNPIAAANMDTDESFNDRITAITNAEFNIVKGLKFNTSLSFEKANNKTQIYLPGSKPNRAAQNSGGYGSINNNDQTTILNENILSYEKKFSNSTFNMILGQTTQSFKGESSFLSGDKLLNDVTKFYALEFTEVDYRTITSGYNQWNIVSFLGRVNYSIAGKYLLTVSFRRDGSSRLGANNKWANFPSAAIAWKMSEEPFIKDLGIFSNLKLRTSYGITGNQGIPTFATLPRLGTLQGVINDTEYTGVIQGTLSNPNIRWETTAQADVGLEAGFFQNRLNFEFDIYYKKTTDLLFDVEVPHFTGFSTQLQNIGSLQNLGYEALIDARIISNQNFSWDVTANISQYKNKILDLGDKDYIETYRLPAPSRALTGKLIEGEPLGIFVGYIVEGVDPASGDFIFKDISGPDGIADGVIDQNDETIIGNSNPKFFGGIQNRFRYKNFGLTFFLQGVYGNDLYNTRLYNSSSLEVAGHELNSYSQISGQWTADNPEGAEWPGAGIANKILAYSNSKFISNGSFLRMKTMEISYTIPKIGNLLNEARIYFTGTNLFLLKDKEYLNYDPEVSQFGTDDVLRGYDNVVYPNNKSFVFGISLTF
ncbi:MAG: TonB-dependent receptor [Bacteroidales bacterium]|nr:TonB-dependent receptor [Bacteroidales bacterium]